MTPPHLSGNEGKAGSLKAPSLAAMKVSNTKKWQDLIFSSTAFWNVSAVKSTAAQLQANLLQLAPTTRTCIWALRSRKNSQDTLILNNLTHIALISLNYLSPQAELNREKSTVNTDLLGVLVLSGKLWWCPFWYLNESVMLLYSTAELHQHQLEALATSTGGHILLICTYHLLLNKEVATEL